jgi:septum site-determining protein MinD
MRLIGIFSGKGGVGKTTIAINLGAVLAKQFNKRITIVDCNVTTSHLGLYLGIYYSPVTLNKVLRGENEIGDALFTHYTGMKIIPASLSFAELEGVDVLYLKEKVASLLDNNDFVLLDSAPGLGREAVASIRASKEIIYVTTPNVPSVMDVIKTNEVAMEAGVKPLGIILNMVHHEKHEMTKDEVEQLTNIPVIGTIPFDKTIRRSLSLKMPSVVLDPNSKSSKEFIKIGEKLTGEKYRGSRETLAAYIRRVLRISKKKERELDVPGAVPIGATP